MRPCPRILETFVVN